jgi:hypothetical protein
MNLFDWHPDADVETVGIPIAMILLNSLIYLNSRYIHRTFGFIVASLMIPFAIWYGLEVFPEFLNDGTNKWGRTTYSPLWFKITQIFMLLSPSLAFALFVFKSRSLPKLTLSNKTLHPTTHRG